MVFKLVIILGVAYVLSPSNSNKQDSPPNRTSPHRPRDVGRNQKMFSGTRFLKLLASPKIISEDGTETATS